MPVFFIAKSAFFRQNITEIMPAERIKSRIFFYYVENCDIFFMKIRINNIYRFSINIY